VMNETEHKSRARVVGQLISLSHHDENREEKGKLEKK